MDASAWGSVEALATAAAATFAGAAIWLSRRDANRRTAFEHLKAVNVALDRAWAFPMDLAQQQILDYWTGKTADLTEGAKAYLNLLTTLDLLALAVHKGIVDNALVAHYVKTLVNDQLLSQSYLKKLQDCCKNEHIYEDLYKYFVETNVEAKGSRLPFPKKADG
jgi:hypothetical protein